MNIWQNQSMEIEKTNKIISACVISTQVVLVVAIGVFTAKFFLEPDERETQFPYLKQWQLEARKPEKKNNPPPPIFVPPPLKKSKINDDINYFGPPIHFTFIPPKPTPLKGKPVKFEKTKVAGIPLYRATIDLNDPETFITLSLPHDAKEANTKDKTHGSESFKSFVNRLNAAIVQNGTFFSKDKEQRVMGNMVANGRWLKYSQWENYGTTFGLRKGNQPEMITARLEGKPKWREHWFSLTCGPRLLKNGEIELDAKGEGFRDPHVLGGGSRCALGYTEKGDKLYLVTFLRGLTLKREAQVMKAMGCYQAMNLDGGASRSMAHGKNIVVPAGRPLTNVIAVYDTNHKAPAPVKMSWRYFQRNKAMIQLIQ